jgi:outer membrane protein assembly factor BamB
VTVVPGFFGGVLTPMAFTQETVCVPVINLPLVYTDTSSEFDLATATGEMVALRASDGSVRWRTEVETFFSGGATVANDVVFGAGLDGMVRAFDCTTGLERWRFQADAGVNAVPAIAGDMLFVPAGAGLIGDRGATAKPEVLAFRLDGADSGATPVASPVAARGGPDTTTGASPPQG